MKKKIVVCVFSVLIAVTVIGFVADAAATYAYEMDPANGEDIFEGFGAVIALLVGFFVVLFEADLFYTVYYFLFKPRTKAKSILNVLACSCWPLFFLAAYLPEKILGFRALEYGISIGAVAAAIIERVKYEVEHHTGVGVGRVNVCVEDIRV